MTTVKIAADAALGKRVIRFSKAYVKSMRLYYSFITGTTGLIGLTYYQYVAGVNGPIEFSGTARTVEIPTTPEKYFAIMLILFLSWGVNQIYNDYFGLKEDRINAPDRPMVTGELNPKAALTLSTVFMLGGLLVTWFYLEKQAAPVLILGVLLNFAYEYSKAHGIWANIIFGLMISSCGMYGFMAAGPSESSIFTVSRLSMIAFVALINGLMTFYTYFKDYEGDKAAGKNTVVVKYGIERSKTLSIILAFLPTAVFLLCYFVLELWPIPLNGPFILLTTLSIVLQVWTGYLYFKNPEGEMTYYSLAMNFRACACSETALIALYNPALGIILFFVTYSFIGFLFNFHDNSKE